MYSQGSFVTSVTVVHIFGSFRQLRLVSKDNNTSKKKNNKNPQNKNKTKNLTMTTQDIHFASVYFCPF